MVRVNTTLALLLALGVVCEVAAQRRSQARPQPKKIDYSRFSHRTSEHQTSCDSCHKFPSKNWDQVRKADDAFPDVTDFPDHAACLDCHRQQFFARELPAPAICSNCHIRVTPRDTRRYVFPSLGDQASGSRQPQKLSQFALLFPHEVHLELVAFKPRTSVTFTNASFGRVSLRSQESDPKSCSVCHQTHQPQGDSEDEFVTAPPKDLKEEAFWLKRGTFKTSPDTHAGCFTCHSTDSGINPLPTECGSCHKLAPATSQLADFNQEIATTIGITDLTTLNAWKGRSAGRFRHEFASHAELPCTSCHNVATLNSFEPESKKVPVTSCGGAEGCHITATSDDGGILNYEIDERKTKPNFECVKCHIVLGKEPVPLRHLEAIGKAASK